MSHDDLLQALISRLQELTEQTIAIARECRFLRRPRTGRGFILSMAPTRQQRMVAEAMQKRFALWHSAVRSVMTRRGISDPSLQRAIEEFFALIEFKYSGEMMTLAPRVLEQFVDAVRATASTLEESLHKYEPHFRHRELRGTTLYDSFGVRIIPADDGWLIRATYDGQCIEEKANRLSAAEMQHLLQVQLHAARGSVQNASPREAEILAQNGNRLFQSVFANLTGALYERARMQAEVGKRAVRIELDLPDEGIAAIPWELLHDGIRFLGLAQDISIVRCIAGARRASRTGAGQPLRMLLTVSSPRDLTRIASDQERRIVQEAVAPLIILDLLQLDIETSGSIRALRRMLETARREGRPYHAWHLAAHGRYDPTTSRGALAMTAPGGTAHWVGAVELASLFSESQLQLVVLSSCHGAEGNPALRWSAAATPFQLCGVPAVVAMQLAISHVAAAAFASQLYGTLVDGGTVEEAVADGRRSIHDLPNSAEWMRPVLFLRG